MKIFYMIGKGLIYLPVKILFPAKIIGKKKIPKKGANIAISNHLSWVDVPLLGVNLKGYRRYLAKKEISENWFAKKIVSLIGGIFVDRNSMDLSAVKKCLNALKKGERMTIFPEGTRNRNGDDLQQVKNGAAMFAIKTKVPLYPIIIYKKAKVFKKNYVMIGDAVDLSEFYDKKLDSQSLEICGAIVQKTMEELRLTLMDYVQNKRWKKKNRLLPSQVQQNEA